MKHLEPLRTYLSPCLTAVVFIPDTSDPASGSVRQKEASFGSSASMPRYFLLISSVPPSATGVIARPFAASEVPIPEQPQPNSSSIKAPDRKSRPGPPYSSGTWVFISPTSQALSMISWGQVPSLSYSQATLRISFSAKLCASSRRSFCSSVSVKSTAKGLLCVRWKDSIDWSVNPVQRVPDLLCERASRPREPAPGDL